MFLGVGALLKDEALFKDVHSDIAGVTMTLIKLDLELSCNKKSMEFLVCCSLSRHVRAGAGILTTNRRRAY